MMMSVKKYVLVMLCLVFTHLSFSQVKVKVDTTQIRIGEQVKYSIITDKSDGVVFPDLKLDASGGIELVEDVPLDTIKDKFYKRYILTSFDSGTHVIPSQKVKIKDRSYLLDSLSLEVRTVAVDTTKQGLHPIKTIYKAPPKTWRDYKWLMVTLVVLLLVGGLIWWLYKRPKRAADIESEKHYSPIELAQLQLKTLDGKDLIINGQTKAYYTELTDVIRNYIENEFQISAMESTSDELVQAIKINQKVKKIGIAKDDIKQLNLFFQSADLVKFAKAKPLDINIKEDRRFAESLVVGFDTLARQSELEDVEAVDLINTDTNTETVVKPRTRKWAFISFGILIFGLLLFGVIRYFGLKNIKDNALFYKTKLLLESEWYTSDYGYPNVKLQAPFLLKTDLLLLPDEVAKTAVSKAGFRYGEYGSSFYLSLNTYEFTKETGTPFAMSAMNAMMRLKNTEGITDLDFDKSESTLDGQDAIFLSGTYRYKKTKRAFKQYFVLTENSLQYLMMSYDKDNPFAKAIENRILESIKLEKQQ